MEAEKPQGSSTVVVDGEQEHDDSRVNDLAKQLFMKKNDPRFSEDEDDSSDSHQEIQSPIVEEKSASEKASEAEVSPEASEEVNSDDMDVDPDPLPDNKPTRPKRKGGRKPVPRRYRGTVGGIRKQQESDESVYRKTTICRHLKTLVRKQHSRHDVKISWEAYHLLPHLVEMMMRRPVLLSSMISLLSGKNSVMSRHAAFAYKISKNPNVLNWSAKDFEDFDNLLEKSQFRGTQLDDA